MSLAEQTDIEWKRLLGFSLKLRGQMACSREAWGEALRFFDKAASIREQLCGLDLKNVSLKSELASVRAWQGQCCRRLNRFETAHDHYKAEYALRKELIVQEPDSGDRLVELIYAQTHLAAWHLARKTSEDDQAALNWLEAAEALLELDKDSQLLSARRRDVENLEMAISKNKSFIAKRAATFCESAD